MTLVDGKNLSEWEGGLFDRDNENSVSLLYRLLWLFTEARAEGITVVMNEAGRPYGQNPPDQAAGMIPPDGDESQTASGRSTVHFQFGRMRAGFTPSAANPDLGEDASRHTVGTASDLGCDNYPRLYQLAARVGLAPTILPEEVWHLDTVGNPDPDIDFSRFTAVVDSVFGRSTPAGEHVQPIEGEEPLKLDAEDQSWVTRTVHDQLNSLLFEDKPEIGQVSVVTRVAQAVNAARDASIRATLNEGRYRLLRLKDGPQAGRIFARDMDTGRELEYRDLKTLAQDIQDDKNAELVGLQENMIEITQKQYDRQKSPFAALVTKAV